MYSPCFSVRHLELRKGGYFGVSASTSPDQYEVCDPSQRSPARPWPSPGAAVAESRRGRGRVPARPWPSPGAAVAESRPRRGWAFRCATTSTCTRSRCIRWTHRSARPHRHATVRQAHRARCYEWSPYLAAQRSAAQRCRTWWKRRRSSSASGWTARGRSCSGRCTRSTGARFDNVSLPSVGSSLVRITCTRYCISSTIYCIISTLNCIISALN
jgi:hypothetical protein